MYMSFNQHRELIQQQFRHVNLPKSLFQRSAAVGNDLDDLIYESTIRSYLRVPRVDKVLEDDRNDGVELDVDLV